LALGLGFENLYALLESIDELNDFAAEKIPIVGVFGNTIMMAASIVLFSLYFANASGNYPIMGTGASIVIGSAIANSIKNLIEALVCFYEHRSGGNGGYTGIN
jgi:hypothetical protein